MNKQLNKQGITRLWLLQLLIIALVSLFALFFSFNEAYSLFLGGLVAILPNVLFASKLFKYQGARAAKQIVNGFYIGEALKIALSIALFSLVFMFCNSTPLAFFIGYVLVLVMHGLTPWIIVNK